MRRWRTLIATVALLSLFNVCDLSAQYYGEEEKRNTFLSNLLQLVDIEPGPQTMRKGFWGSADIGGGLTTARRASEMDYVSPGQSQVTMQGSIGAGYHFNHMWSGLVGVSFCHHENPFDIADYRAIYVEARCHPILTRELHPLSINLRLNVPYDNEHVPMDLGLSASWSFRNSAWLFGLTPTLGIGYMPFRFDKFAYTGVNERGAHTYENIGTGHSFRLKAFFTLALTIN